MKVKLCPPRRVQGLVVTSGILDETEVLDPKHPRYSPVLDCVMSKGEIRR